MNKRYLSGLLVSFIVSYASCSELNSSAQEQTFHTKMLMAKLKPTKAPAINFNLSKWKINLPMEDDKPSRAGKVMEISAKELSDPENPYEHVDWFSTDKKTGAMVFTAPNKAFTTANSKNARSELRAMLASSAKDPKNNFVLAANPDALSYGAIGGRLTATLSVDWVSTSGSDKKNAAFSTVIGQIHASQNEPLKIAYRKLPDHEYGSLFWVYEINATSDNYSKRKDIYHNVFGQYNLRADSSDPADGIKLGELFSYAINVENNLMKLTFKKNIGETTESVKTFVLDISKGNYQGNKYDQGYANDWMYYKVGNYNQCNVGASKCTNKGLKAGDYSQVSFYQLELEQ